MIYYLNSLPTSSGNKVVIADYDFTESLTDKVNGFTSTLFGATRDSNGVHITAASQYLRINELFGLLRLKLCTFELDIGNMERMNPSTQHCRFFMFDVSSGFVYRNNGHWNVYNANSWRGDGLTDPNIFKNSKCIIKMSRDNSFKVYKNNTLVYETTIPTSISGSNNFFIGSETQSFYNLDIKSLKIYIES